MDKIDKKDFLYKQPGFPKAVISDMFYYDVANRLFDVYAASEFSQSLPAEVGKGLCMGLVGYFQDIVADAGIWRSFVDTNRRLYGWSVPFHEEGEEYIDYELNKEDVRFLTWYIIAMTYEDMRDLYPHDSRLLELADALFACLDSRYDDAPEPEGYNLARGLEFSDPEDKEEIYHLGSWLFLHCYLMTPAFALTMNGIMADPELLKSNDVVKLHNRIEQSMLQDPTGPLALYIPEWLELIIDGKIHGEKKPEKTPHPYYDKFMSATNGKRIQYFGDYIEMNRFFIDKMGWDKNQEHLPVLKNDSNFVVLVNPERGMLVARNAAQCIADPDNRFYDKEYARENAFDFLTVRGRCPADLVKYAFSNGWLPDVVFPGTADNDLVRKNHDFIARCYLQQYYRD